MAFFKSSKSQVDEVQERCARVTAIATVVREKCEASLRGQYEYMQPEERAELLREADALAGEFRRALEQARESQRAMERDQAPGEALLTAESLVLSAGLDANQADRALAEAKNNFVAGMNEIEEFYGPRSKEARHLRKIVARFQTSG